MTELAIRAIHRAPVLAFENRQSVVTSAHLLLATLECEADAESRLGQILGWGGFKREELALYASAWLEAHAPSGAPRAATENAATQAEELPLGPDFTIALQWAANEANFAMNPLIGPEHLFLALVRAQAGEHVGDVLRPLGRDLAELRTTLRSMSVLDGNDTSGHPLGMLGASGLAALDAAQNIMRATFCGRISTAHLLLAVLESKDASATGSATARGDFASANGFEGANERDGSNGLDSADERASSADILGAAGVDVAELRLQARAAIASDGTVATSDKRFDVSAKRALERAKTEAVARGQRFIERDHILIGLLPHRVTWRERRMFGMGVADPLEGVWNRALAEVDEERLQRALDDLDASPVAVEPLLIDSEPEPTNWIRLDWRFVAVGIAWWSWALLRDAPGVRLSMLAGAFLVAAMLALIGESLSGRPLVNRAASFLVGMSLGIGVLFFIGGILVTRR